MASFLPLSLIVFYHLFFGFLHSFVFAYIHHVLYLVPILIVSVGLFFLFLYYLFLVIFLNILFLILLVFFLILLCILHSSIGSCAFFLLIGFQILQMLLF